MWRQLKNIGAYIPRFLWCFCLPLLILVKRQLGAWFGRYGKYLPIVLSIATIFFTAFDIYTDIKSSERICGSQCTCIHTKGDIEDCPKPTNESSIICNEVCLFNTTYHFQNNFNSTCTPEIEEVMHEKHCGHPRDNKFCKYFCDAKGGRRNFSTSELSTYTCNLPENAMTQVKCGKPKLNDDLCIPHCKLIPSSRNWGASRCEGFKQKCGAPTDRNCFNVTLSDMNMTAHEFCDNNTKSKDPKVCSAHSWEAITGMPTGLRKPTVGIRHPWWCGISIGSVILSSLLNNVFLAYRMIHYYVTYCQILGFARLEHTSTSSSKYAVMACIVWLGTIQLLPLLWLLIAIYSEYLKLHEGAVIQDRLELTTISFKKIFTVAEDLPQLFMQILFVDRAIAGQEEGMENPLSTLVIMGLVMSCFNAALNSTLWIKKKTTRVATAFFTAFVLFSRIELFVCSKPATRYFFILIVVLVLMYELINCNQKDHESVTIDFWGAPVKTIDNYHEDDDVEGLRDNIITIKRRILDYAWRCIDGIFFDVTKLSLRGWIFSCFYLFSGLVFVIESKETIGIYQISVFVILLFQLIYTMADLFGVKKTSKWCKT
ncbi:unnamed protein product [Meganyctiphanes norvegica]|uniref:XK-related protein n=1 Tax=Meganyctiphanes norvegica TaxID=48144 RepID=A0AAV2PHE8_MEGNR